MPRARIDAAGTIHCWRCGGTSFTRSRTKTGCASFGLLAPKQTRCVACGSFQRQGKPKAMGALGPTPPPAAGPPPGWFRDPHGEPVERWWDGARWTEHTRNPPAPPPPPSG